MKKFLFLLLILCACERDIEEICAEEERECLMNLTCDPENAECLQEGMFACFIQKLNCLETGNQEDYLFSASDKPSKNIKKMN